MSNLKEVVRKTLIRLQNSGQMATPDAYREAFCIEAKSAGLSVEDCQWQARWSQKFDPKTRTQIQSHVIKTPDEFISLIAGMLTRLSSGEIKEVAQLQREILRSMLSVLSQTPDVAELARDMLSKLETLNDAKSFTFYRDKWNELLKNRADQSDANAEFAKVLEPFLAPSISPFIPAEILELKSIIKATPSAIMEVDNRSKLEQALSGRITADKRESTRKRQELGEIIEVLVTKLSTITQTGDYYRGEINHIGKTLEGMILNPKSLEKAKGRLLDIIQQVDSHIQGLTREVEDKRSEIETLSMRVEELSSELSKAREEASTDALTGVCTRRSMEDALNRLESLYLRYESCYSVAFFDIDFFKKINDKYGHEAGDKVLASFGKLLKQSTRQEDVVSRYGGEEFVVLLPEMNHSEAWRFAERVRALIETSVFVYQDMRINVSVSGGIAERTECDDRKELLKLADSRLYEAKNQGRNQIRPLGIKE